MLVEHLLDLPGVHVVTGPDDHVLLAVDDEVVAVLVLGGQITGGEPAVFHHRRGGLRPLPVTLHHVVAADADLADLTAGYLATFVVDQPHRDAPDRGADRAGLALPVRA